MDTTATATALTPYIMTQDIEPLIAFAKDVFGGVEIGRGTGSAGGTHCEIRIGNSVVMFGGAVPGEPVKPRLIGLHVYVDDADAVYARAMAAGATSLDAPADRHYGERAGFVKDTGGNHWYIATRTAPTYFAKEPRTVTPNLYVHRQGGRSAQQLLEFLQAAFGAEAQLFRNPEGQVQHGVVWIHGAPIELGEGEHPAFGGAPAALVVNVTDCDATYQAALAAGGTAMFPPAPQPFGGRMAGVVDPVGNEWYLASK
jgi:PhnB protein